MRARMRPPEQPQINMSHSSVLLIVTMGRESKKTTVYAKRQGDKVVYKGKKDNSEKQAKAPTQQGKRFTIPTTSFEVCRPTTKKEKPDTE
jgi:hypothetical protein